MSVPVIGVLALQGDVREHSAVLERCGAQTRAVRRPSELDGLQGIVLPGGESTTMSKLAVAFEIFEPLRERLHEGLPALGTCAGMIMLADRILDPRSGQQTFGGIDITVRRNAFGRQIDSFESELEFANQASGDTPLHAVFIRAPWVEEAGDSVDVLARVRTGPAAGRIVAVQQGHLMATSFHPEVTDDDRIHRAFLNLI
ncbi:MAG TPA: pyridoxal 5'-phosphate synthase glutaminase subunit PdxT [Marmoricola sp.]|nr:pyridoxal 5'-phosphate synthase glutaminase subunit PdxT [Marmoricola sp.]